MVGQNIKSGMTAQDYNSSRSNKANGVVSTNNFGKVMAEVVDLNLLNNTNSSWVELTQNLGEVTYEMAFPSSRNEFLRNVYEFTCNCDENDLLFSMSKLNDLFVKPEIIPVVELLDLPNDYNSVFVVDYSLDIINSSQAWDITTGSQEIIIAITDSNYDIYHEELTGKFSFLQSGLTNTNKDHGSAVAGLAAGNTNNGVGKSSIGWNSDLKLYGMGYNSLLTATYSGAHVINASWAAGCTYSEYYQGVINEVLNNGSIIVAAAGNGSTCGGPNNYVYPASFDGVISVSSVGPNYNHERVVGDVNTTHQHNDKVTICAPGYDVPMIRPNNQYITGNGSSFAAPIVSGTIALMLSVNPCLTLETILEILDETSRSLDETNPQYSGKLGFGLIDAGLAVSTALNYVPKIISNQGDNCVTGSGEIEIEIIGGVGPYTINWSSGHSGNHITNLNSGLYSVEVIDANGCSVTEEYELTISEIIVNASVENVTEYGLSNGSIALEVYSDDILTYIWSNGSIEQNLDSIPSGYYTVSIFNDRGCSVIESYFVDEPDQVIIDQPTPEDEFDVVDETNNNEDEDEDLTAGLTVNNVDIKLYPNPSTDFIFVNWGDLNVININVINSNGQLVINEDIINDNFLKINGLSSGKYFVNITTSENSRIVKQVIVL